jgi:hypothetical protein
MAQMVGEKVNCSWSLKRLTTEHDKWSKIVTQVLLESEPLIDLTVHPIFVEFAAHSGYTLLTTNHELISEGRNMNHCVGTYIEKVDNGECAIYDVNDYTLQLTVLEFKEINVNSNYINCYNAVLKDADIHKKRLRSNYNITSTPEHDKLIKHGIWLHNNQFKGRFNKSAPNELYKEVEKKLLEFSLNYDFGAIYERYQNPSQAELKFKQDFDDKIAKAFEDELLPFQ